MRDDKSNGYEAVAEQFMRARTLSIGPGVVREWSGALPDGCTVFDLGCGSGVPISQTLADEGFPVWGIDASATMIAAFRERFPKAGAECGAVEDSNFFERKFDAIIAWGLLFLLPADVQAHVIGKAARALNTGGRFLFTAPELAHTWTDVMTKRPSVSLGRERYLELLDAEGLELVGERSDEGENHYYLTRKVDGRGTPRGTSRPMTVTSEL